MRVNIYMGNKLLEENKFFRSLEKAQTYCKFVCPKIYGAGYYYPIIRNDKAFRSPSCSCNKLLVVN